MFYWFSLIATSSPKMDINADKTNLKLWNITQIEHFKRAPVELRIFFIVIPVTTRNFRGSVLDSQSNSLTVFCSWYSDLQSLTTTMSTSILRGVHTFKQVCIENYKHVSKRIWSWETMTSCSFFLKEHNHVAVGTQPVIPADLPLFFCRQWLIDCCKVWH